MSRFMWMIVAGALVGTGCGEPTPALSAMVQFQGFTPGCVRAVSRDPATEAETTETFEVEPERGQHRIAIYRPEGWGDVVVVRVEGLEKTCDGAPVARVEETARFPAQGFNQVTLVLAATDADADGFVSTGAVLPGRDCDDSDHFRAPDVGELCDSKDNDCDGETDEDAVCG